MTWDGTSWIHQLPLRQVDLSVPNAKREHRLPNVLCGSLGHKTWGEVGEERGCCRQEPVGKQVRQGWSGGLSLGGNRPCSWKDCLECCAWTMVLAWPWSSWTAPRLLVGTQNGTAALAKFGCFLFLLLLFNILFIYLHALGLGFGTQDLSLQHRHSACGMGLVVAVLRLSCSKPHRILVPRQGIEPKPPALQVDSQPLDQEILVVSYKAKHTLFAVWSGTSPP